MRQTALGAFMLSSSLLAFSIQDAIVKFLSNDYAVLQILTIRIAFVLLLVLSIGATGYGFKSFVTPHYKLLLFRGVLAFLAFTTYYLALAVIPMTSVAAVYMSAPLFVTALSALFLKEVVGVHRWLSVLVGFSAVLLIINPSAEAFRIEATLPLLSALFYSLLPIITRHIGQQVSAITMTAYNALSYLFACFIAAGVISVIPVNADSSTLLLSITADWTRPSVPGLAWMVLSSFIFTVAVLCITQAYRIASVSAIAPFEYTLLIWTTLVGYVIFSEIPSFRTIAGSLVIVACGVYILYRETTARKSSSIQ